MADKVSDHDLAQMIMCNWAHDYAWSSGLGWLKHDLTLGVWKEISDPTILAQISTRLVEIKEELLVSTDAPSPARTKQLAMTSKASAVERLLRGMLEIDHTVFDSNPYELNCPNGVVNLRTGELRAHALEDRFLKQTRANYVPGASAPDWLQALEAMDEPVRNWMQRRMGLGIVGNPDPFDEALFMVGTNGRNGKSMLFAAILQALGPYAAIVPQKLLIADIKAHSVEKMALLGLRLAFLEELPEGRHLTTATLKTITGTEEISARRIMGNNVSFQPTHSLFITSNYMPSVAEVDGGTWRRIVVVPFPYEFVHMPIAEHERQADGELKQRLRDGSASEAVLAWLVQGAVLALSDPDSAREHPQAVSTASKEVRIANDLIATWVQEEAQFDEEAWTPRSEIHKAFVRWCRASGYNALNARTFWERWSTSQTLKVYTATKRKGTFVINGIKLPPDNLMDFHVTGDWEQNP